MAQPSNLGPASEQVTARQDGLLRRIARLHPGWNCALIFVSLIFPVFFGAHLDDLQRHATPGAGLLVLLAANLSILFPLLYIYGLVVLLSGRFHSPWPRRLGGASVAITILAASILGFLPLVAVVDAWDESDKLSLALGVLLVFMAAVVSFWKLVSVASDVLLEAEQTHGNWLRAHATSMALYFWPIGFFWIQARVRSLVKEFDTGQFSRLPLEAVGFRDDGLDRSISLTRRVGPQHAEAYAEQLARRAGGSITRRHKSARGLNWDITIDKEPLRLVFENDPPLFTLHTESDPEDEVLFKTWMRLR